ncbi:MAG: hypothetical protein ACPG4Q_01810 [Phycisphaeraceae bacterium]
MTTADTIRLDQLDARIRSVWVRGQLLHLIAGALAFVRWAIPLFLVGMFIDWMTYMPSVGRAVILLVLLGVSLFRAWRCGWQHLRPFNAVATALQLEAKHGELKSLLVSAIQLRSQPATTGSTALRDHTCQLAEEAAQGLQPNKTVPFKPLQQPGVIVALLIGVIALFAMINGPFLGAGVARIFAPWTSLEYPTNTQISLAEDELIIKEGDSAEITAQLTGIIPKQATIYVRTGEGKARAIDLDVVNDSSTYTIASASRDFTYRIKAGDDRTQWHTVRVIPAPRIEQVALNLAYPDYLDRKNETIEALTLTVPEGTDVDWNLKLDRPIQSAKFVRDGEEPIDLNVESDGKTIAFTADVTASQGYHFKWVDKDQGYEFTSPRYFLQVAADQAPRVELIRPASNLVAMIGRPMDLAVRVQDDHGIGSTKIAYRVNQLDEKMLDLPNAAQVGQGEQAIDWDYREALADLQIGDTVSITVEVSDKYPGQEGPHVVRSETRRISFLSKEQYLEQIKKQRDRLLSRVQTIYRQQRGAHDIVRTLTPASDGYLQACQLEAIRQEMIRDQLKEIGRQMQALLDDLAANGVADEAQGEALVSIRAVLLEIADTDIANAATLLREQSAAAAEGTADGPAKPSAAVNTAARKLGSLVLLRGIESAQEVYARESRMLAQLQADIRWQTVTDSSSETSPQLVERQNELADWTDQLINDLQAGMRYDRRPLAVLRLIRSVKDLRENGTVETMRQAGTLINQKQAQKASAAQAQLVKSLLNAEFSVRLSGAYATLIKTRDLVGSMSAVQQQLHTNIEGLSAEAFATQGDQLADIQASLRKQLLTLMLPTVPASRSGLFDETPPQAPPIDDMLSSIDSAMRQSLDALKSGEQKTAQAAQRESKQSLDKLYAEIDRWSVEMGLQTQGLSTLVAATSERMSRLEEFEARVIGLLEKTDLTAADDKNVNTLAESQQNLAGDIGAFIKALKKDDQTQPDPDLPPMLSRVESAEDLLNQGVEALKANDADQAIGLQEQAADTLAEAYAIVVAQNERLAILQSMLMFQRSVGFANGYMADIVAEQRDLLAATEALKPEEMKVLLPQFAHMRECIHDVAPLLDLVGSRLDVGTPLAFAKTDFEDAIAALEVGDQFEAVDAQDVAAESLAKVQLLVQDIRTQTGYLAEIVEYLHQSVSDASLLAYQQRELRKELLAVEQDDLSRFAESQQKLLAQAARQDKLLRAAAGNPKLVPPPDPLFPDAEPAGPEPVLSLPSEDMELVLEALKDNDAATAAEAMELVEMLYAENSEAMLVVLGMLEGLPQVTIVSDTDPALVRLVDTLAVASDFKALFRQTQVAGDDRFEGLGKTQSELAANLSKLAAGGEPHLLLTAASKHLNDAAGTFSPSSREQLRTSQRAGDEQLRHFIVEQALVLDTSIPPPSSSDAPATDGPGSDTEADVTAGFIADFVSGETPSDKRSEWKVLGERNRAALNQNFARELPLEYRGLLKNYYERVADDQYD